MRVTLLLATVAVSTIGLHRAVAEPPTKIAVVPGIAVNLDAARVDALSQDLADALNAELIVDATGGLAVRRDLPADGVAPDCVTTPSCVADVAKRPGASQLLFVVMVDSGSGNRSRRQHVWSGCRVDGFPPIAGCAVVTSAKERFSAAAHTRCCCTWRWGRNRKRRSRWRRKRRHRV
jgi:hypothetical protein